MHDHTIKNDAIDVASPPPSSVPDLDRYAADLEGLDLTENQQQELLENLWRIMHAFVEMGFRVDICEQLFPEFNGAVAGDSRAVDCPRSTIAETPLSGKEST